MKAFFKEETFIIKASIMLFFIDTEMKVKKKRISLIIQVMI